MASAINIGVDFGSTGLRAAYVRGEEAIMLSTGVAEATPWLLCELAPHPPGVAFPSLKSKLGKVSRMRLEGRELVPGEDVTVAFRTLCQSVEKQLGKRVAQAVVAVPARYSARQRAALREAVLAAGLKDVQLLNDTAAAVLAHCARHGEREGATLLVYGMGYSGFELGLVRAARGHLRVLGYEGGEAPAGRFFDALVIDALLTARRPAAGGEPFSADVSGWDEEAWLRAHAIAQRLKEALSEEAEVALPVAFQTPAGRLWGTVLLQRQAFAEAIAPALATTLEGAGRLLEEAGMEVGDLDEVLLTGGSTRIPRLREQLTRAFGLQPTILAAEDLARGAALQAARLRAEPTVADHVLAGASAPAAPVAVERGLRAELTVEGEGPAVAVGEPLVLPAKAVSAAAPAPELARARELLAAGREEEARGLLQSLIAEAQALLDRAGAAGPGRSSPGALLARRAFERAERDLRQGRQDYAVRESHLAWQEDRENPDVFERMLEIHCRAAASVPDPERYDDAVRWLMCAYSHDQSNTRIRQLIAERHYHQARTLHQRGESAAAAAPLGHCLALDPEHRQAQALETALREG